MHIAKFLICKLNIYVSFLDRLLAITINEDVLDDPLCDDFEENLPLMVNHNIPLFS